MGQSKAKLEYRNRDQVYLGPVDLNALVEAGHPARAVWAVLEGIDFSLYEEQIRSREGEAGRSAVPPRLLAALWIYGYSLGVGSARALERMQSYEPGLRWLCADEPVNHHTLSDFRVGYEEALDELFSQVLAGLEQGGVVDLGTVVVDGTKVRAASGAGSLHRRATLEESLRQAEDAAAGRHTVQLLQLRLRRPQIVSALFSLPWLQPCEPVAPERAKEPRQGACGPPPAGSNVPQASAETAGSAAAVPVQ